MKKIFCLLIFILSCQLDAQSPNWIWAKAIYSNDAEFPRTLAFDHRGNLFATGRYSGSTVTIGSTTLTNSIGGKDEIYISKYDPNGNALWAKSYGGWEHDDIHDISVDSLGNCYVIGEFASNYISFGTTTIYNTGGGKRNIFLAKLDSMGNEIWIKNYGDSGDDYGMTLEADKDGNIFFMGSFENSITIGTQTLTATFGSNCFLAKCDPNGNEIWAQTAGSGSFADGIAVDNNSCAYIAGSFMGATANFGALTFTNTSIGVGSTDAFIVKYDPDGAVVWAINTSGDYSEEMRGIKSDKAGHIYFTGNFFTAWNVKIGTVSVSTPGIINSFVGKVSQGGNISWLNVIKNNRVNYSHSMATGHDGFVYLGGTYDLPVYFGTDSVSGLGNINAYIAKFDTTGVFKWATGISGNVETQLSCILTNNNSEIYAYGSHRCTPGLTIGTTTLINNGNYDVYIAKMDASVVGISEIVDERNSVLIYPNPNNGNFKVTGDFNPGTELLLTDLLGRVVHSQKLFSGENEILTHHLAKTIYHYSILHNRISIGSGKILIE